ncbi:MAG: FHA domain-containing protein [Planctomycetota bacterium]
MSLLISHLSGSRSGEVESFASSSVIIGRGEENDLAFDPFEDAVVSTQHAEIRFESDGFVLYDMGSLNGTFLNGLPVRRACLSKGDEIGLGRKGPRLLFDLNAGQMPNRPSVIPMRLPDIKTPGGSLKTQMEFPVPTFEEQVASRDWRFYLAIGITALVLALACFFFIV